MTERLPKAILLDLDDTILEFSSGAEPCWRDVCQRFATHIVGIAPDRLFDAIDENRRWFWSDPGRHQRGRLHPDAALREIVTRALHRLRIEAPDLSIEIVDSFTKKWAATIHPFPRAIEALHFLRETGVRLALITNGSAQTQRDKIDRFGLEPLFDCILIEGEIEIGKPDERVYRRALDQLGVQPKAAWMIGDHLDWDVAAPQRLGIRGIWLDWAGAGLPDNSPVQPDLIIRSLAELIEP
jgi:putative hydrolase of the HAD superfamily